MGNHLVGVYNPDFYATVRGGIPRQRGFEVLKLKLHKEFSKNINYKYSLIFPKNSLICEIFIDISKKYLFTKFIRIYKSIISCMAIDGDMILFNRSTCSKYGVSHPLASG